MGNRISRSTKSKGSAESSNGESFDYSDGATSTHSTPKFPDLPLALSEVETARQRNEHFLLKHVFQKSYFAPIDNMLEQENSNVAILDYGSGVCFTWIVEMANDFPNTMCYGLNLFKIPDTEDFPHIPPNLHFDKANILQGIDHPNESFDFIHQRNMVHLYHGDDISFIIGEMMRLLKPGGYVEFVEYDILPKRSGPLFSRLFECVLHYLKSQQKYLFQGPRLKRFLQESGFQDVKAEYVSIPVCWGGYMGKLMYENILAGVRHLGPIIYQDLMKSDADFDEKHFEEYVDKAFDECVEYKTFSNIHWAYGKKPA
ncbi:hypothetical protein BDC45DRAFT_511196 [Circinella umbellata]|nr:hypothetical protein BDC45DRAFT_511196 [Circinella umbellata]